MTLNKAAAARLVRTDTWFRYWMPYQFVRLENHGRRHLYLPLNRYYKPFGVSKDQHVDYELFSHQAAVFSTDPRRLKRVWHNVEALYLYDDTVASRVDYFERLERLMSHELKVLRAK